jgi:HlyD family secretion protein
VAVVVAMRMHKKPSALAAVSTETVERRDIVVTVEATGTVEPINLVEVKSKASGLIVKMPVEIGTHVKKGDLLVQIDPRDVESAYQEARAASSLRSSARRSRPISVAARTSCSAIR